ncbi:luciferin sulfotransferase [Tribolium castaneum]|uniref:luciferin sulfotransferase n=1 Tax=Tribolium castaneum TaxID=7070 RepID=UPI0030FF20DC
MVAKDLDKILEEKFTSTFRKGYVTINGHMFPKRYEDLKEGFDNLEVSEEDVWICSFPKTGTTWTQEMVWMIVNNLDFKEGEINLGIRSPFLELSIIFDYRDMLKNNPNFDPPMFLQNSLEFVKTLKSPICMKTHLPYECLPKDIQEGRKNPKMIYVVRDPKDTCISYFHHCKLMEGFRGDFEEFCELFLAGKVNFGPFWKHVLTYWEKRNSPNFFFLKYEDMKKDLPKVIRQVAQFLERPLSDEKVEILTKHLSFESMKNNPAVNYGMVCDLNKKFKLIEHDGAFMRSGKVGGHKEVMSEEMIRKFDDWIKRNVEGTDYVI